MSDQRGGKGIEFFRLGPADNPLRSPTIYGYGGCKYTSFNGPWDVPEGLCRQRRSENKPQQTLPHWKMQNPPSMVSVPAPVADALIMTLSLSVKVQEAERVAGKLVPVETVPMFDTFVVPDPAAT